jgi:predicted DNA-binding protein with PD1-like motif
MKRMKLLLCLLSSSLLFAQVKRHEEVAKATPADLRPSSPSVPESTAISTQFERVVVIRLKHQTDILAALEKQVKEQKIENAIILMGFGSATSTHYHVVSNHKLPPSNLFVENETNGVDIVNINGAVFNGRVHAHITYADGEKAFGGHLEPRSRAFTFTVITLGVLPKGLQLSRYDDANNR